jgi:hypothetical protein
MKTSNMRFRICSSAVGKIVMALACASMIGGMFIEPAFADDHGRREGYQRGRYQKSRRVYQPRHRYYPAPVYVPPPVVYYPAPYQSPGINIVLPFHFD